MEGHAHSLRLPVPTPRRPMHQRTASSSSEASQGSHTSHQSHGSEDQFVLSPAQTPANENAPARVMIPRFATDPAATRNGLLLGKVEVNSRVQASGNYPTSPTRLRVGPSKNIKPVVIELPEGPRADDATSPASAASVHIPPPPLSARGDVPGGYFPLHEDPDSRVHIPHPFHLEADMAHRSSVRRTAESSKSGAEPRSSSPPRASRPARAPPSKQTNAAASLDARISSYMPSGLYDDVALPMGKYYPSNWETRHGKPSQARPSAMAQPAPSSMRSEPQVPKFQGDQLGPQRSVTDVKRRLLQYQRDMVAQAANALIASTGSAGSSYPSGVPPPKGQLAAMFLRTHKPPSPRLEPVGSPGPVTPMSLEADSYLSLGPSSMGGGMNTGFPGLEIRDGKRVGRKGKHRRKDSRSSPLELTTASI
ncbi:uncharacterized protein B0H64DRAFT_65719 [Chaetomium fimeti]|uniref:Uncharacterized protein n=1 Tax=Chaetomium fimeti TaxID=1854472 RepID=A0AAE0LUU3_9PEZI|nr:hypothetical protein B0H64DRAFT_65719 [Chaetomium fimeti]